MAGDEPHRFALFSLLPTNAEAAAILRYPENAYLVSKVKPSDTMEATDMLSIGFHIGGQSRGTLATIGRQNADITIRGDHLSRIQCSFEIHERTEEIMLQDRSSNLTTQCLGPTASPFEFGRCPRRVVLDKNTNLEFGFGGILCDEVTFQIIWHERKCKISELLNVQSMNPQVTRTKDLVPTQPSSARVTRIHTPVVSQKIRYSIKHGLGAGTFGKAFKVVDVDTGEFIALKQIAQPDDESCEAFKHLKREVELHSCVYHENIVKFIGHQSSTDQDGLKCMEIFMELKHGNIKDLIRKGLYEKSESNAIDMLLRQMLPALDYLASKGIIHRDIKPENILYTRGADGAIKYELADFGLSNHAAYANSQVGTPMYAAPEVFRKGVAQTTKLDVYSLFVTVVYALNINNFQNAYLETPEARTAAIRSASEAPVFAPIRAMALEDPARRASAAEILDQVYNGEGRSSRRTLPRFGAPAVAPTTAGPSTTPSKASLAPPTEPFTAEAKSKKPVRQGLSNGRVEKVRGGGVWRPSPNPFNLRPRRFA